MGTIGYNRRGKHRKNKLRSDKMPYINCVTSQKLTEEEKERIKGKPRKAYRSISREIGTMALCRL